MEETSKNHNNRLMMYCDFAKHAPEGMSEAFPGAYVKQIEAGVPEIWSGDGTLRTTEQCRQWAEALNCDILYPKANQLFIDIDGDESWKRFMFIWPYFAKHFYPAQYTATPSKSGLPRRHVVVNLGYDDKPDKYVILVRILMQSLLGSDPMRELISLRRTLDVVKSHRVPEDAETIICFFEPKPSNLDDFYPF